MNVAPKAMLRVQQPEGLSAPDEASYSYLRHLFDAFTAPYSLVIKSIQDCMGFRTIENKRADDFLAEVIDSDLLFQELAEATIEAPCLEKGEVNSLFFDIKCPRETAIWLSGGPASPGKYIHGNRVGFFKGKEVFVAQYPIDRSAFWRHVRQSDLFVVDLTNENDNLPPLYYSEGHKVREATDSYTLYEEIDGGEEIVLRVRYRGWKDHQSTDSETLLQLIQKIEALATEKKQGCIIHCRGGVGRSGTLASLLFLKELLPKWEGTLENAIFSVVLDGRGKRGRYYVEKKAQLKLIVDMSKSFCSFI